MKVTGTLKYARKTNIGDRFILSGNLYNDIHTRWKDGAFIHTSYVTQEHPDQVYETRSGSFYKVESWSH